MTDEELVKRLRERGTYNEVFSNAVWDSTADRIEPLPAVQPDAIQDKPYCWSCHYSGDCRCSSK